MGDSLSSEAQLPIIQYWDKEDVPDDISDLLATFGTHNSNRPHFVFSEATASALITEHFGRREANAFASCAVPAMQADYFRYCALYVLGGAWFDADCHCRTNLSSVLVPGSAKLFEGPDGAMKNWVLLFGVKEHPLLRMIIALATTNITHGIFDKVWITTGPAILRVLVDIWRSGSSKSLFETVGALVGADSPEKTSYLESLRKIVGDGMPVVKAFDFVDVVPIAEMDGLVHHGSSHLRYKRTTAHYPNFTSSIYRRQDQP